MSLRKVLALIATQPDARDNDVRSIELLASSGLADLNWIQSWMEFKDERWQARRRLLDNAGNTVGTAQRAARGNAGTTSSFHSHAPGPVSQSRSLAR